MKVISHYPLVEDLIAPYEKLIGRDLAGYKNHVYRVANYCTALGVETNASEVVQIASVFHDIGIWTAHTFDYIGPSKQEATCYLKCSHKRHLIQEVELLIEKHHKLRKYRGMFSHRVEPFRRADTVDLCMGLIRFGLPPSYMQDVMAAFPNCGFHKRLASFAIRRAIQSPLSPLPMVRW